MFQTVEFGFSGRIFFEHKIIANFIMISCTIHSNKYTINTEKETQEYEETGWHHTLCMKRELKAFY